MAITRKQVRVKLEEGLTPINCSKLLASFLNYKTSYRISYEAYLKRTDRPEIRVNIREILTLISLEITEGTSLEVEVESERETYEADSLASSIALWLEDKMILDAHSKLPYKNV